MIPVCPVPDSNSKWCPECGHWKSLDEFFTDRRARDGKTSYCKPCQTERNAASNEVAAMIEAQGGLCAVCRVKPAEHVDHDHETGAVRGILCFTCNCGLGNFNDDTERLDLARRYLARLTPEQSAHVRARFERLMGKAS